MMPRTAKALFGIDYELLRRPGPESHLNGTITRLVAGVTPSEVVS